MCSALFALHLQAESVCIRTQYFLQEDGPGAEREIADVRICLRGMRGEVLRGCYITFSQIMDGNLKAQVHRSAFWQLANSLGAICCENVNVRPPVDTLAASTSDAIARSNTSVLGQDSGQEVAVQGLFPAGSGLMNQPSSTGEEMEVQAPKPYTTHVVSLSRLTDKAKRAQELKNVAMVSPDWLLASEIECAHSLLLHQLLCLLLRLKKVLSRLVLSRCSTRIVS